jgi:iron complex outermembrane receptor protein
VYLETWGTDVVSIKNMKFGRQLMIGVSLLAFQNGLAQGAFAQDVSQQAQSPILFQFDISAQPLPQALTAFSDVTGIQILYTEQSIYGHDAPALAGEYSADEALGALLSGSNVDFSYTSENSITLRRNSASGDMGEVTLDTVEIIGTRQSRYDSRYAE